MQKVLYLNRKCTKLLAEKYTKCINVLRNVFYRTALVVFSLFLGFVNTLKNKF